jgi:uncharacterized Tic20 family protein
MNGREHMFWSLAAFSIAMFVFTDVMNYRNASQLNYIAVIVIFVLMIIVNELGNISVEKIKKMERKKEQIDDQKKSEMNLYIVITRIFAYLLLGAFVVFTAWFSAPSTDNPFFLVAGYAGAFLGGRIPDFDKDVTDGYHILLFFIHIISHR